MIVHGVIFSGHAARLTCVCHIYKSIYSLLMVFLLYLLSVIPIPCHSIVAYTHISKEVYYFHMASFICHFQRFHLIEGKKQQQMEMIHIELK